MLGAPVALAACKASRGRPRLPDGELVLRAERLGHAVRDGQGVRPAADAWEHAAVVIVGGGVAGLSAAWRLRRAGFDDFVVLELAEVPGGTAASGASDVSAYPWGAHYITAPMRDNPALVALLAELDALEGEDPDTGEPVVREHLLCRDPESRVFYRGRWYEGLYLFAGASAEDLRQRDRFLAIVSKWASWRDTRGRRAFALPVAAGTDDVEVTGLDRMSMAAWLAQEGFDSPRLRWLIDYACRDDYGADAANTSAWAALLYFASRQRDAEAESQSVVTWPEGNGRLVRHLRGAARGRERLGWAVAHVAPGADRIDVVALRDGASAAGVRADQVIYAAPHFTVPYVVRDAPAEIAREFHYGSWMVANLHLRDRPTGRGFPLCWDNVLYDSPSLGYVVATHQRGIDRGPTVLTYYYPLVDDDPRAARSRLYEAGWAEWADVALTDLSRAHPHVRDLVTRLDVVRWGHAMVRPRPGFAWGAARRAREPVRGVHFAHTDLSGIALFEEAFYHGLRAAEEVLAARGIPFEAMT